MVVSRFNNAVLLDEPVAAAIRETDKCMFLARVCKEFDQAIVVSRDENLAKLPKCRILKLTRASS